MARETERAPCGALFLSYANIPRIYGHLFYYNTRERSISVVSRGVSKTQFSAWYGLLSYSSFAQSASFCDAGFKLGVNRLK